VNRARSARADAKTATHCFFLILTPLESVHKDENKTSVLRREGEFNAVCTF
jgi:hypothetical protein